MRVEKSIDGCVVKDERGRVLARGQVEAQVMRQAQEVLARESKSNANSAPNQSQSAPAKKTRKRRRKKASAA